jgi:acetylornithine deacetylase
MAPLLHYASLLLFAVAEASPAAYPADQTKASSVVSTSPSSTPKANPLTDEEKEKLFDLHEKLVDIPSITGDEAEVSEFVEEYLSDLGYHVETVEVEEGRNNVFAYPKELKDEGAWPEVLITSHIDTVRFKLSAKCSPD